MTLPSRTFTAVTCDCSPHIRQWNGFGTCLSCGGAYEATGPLAPIVVPRTSGNKRRTREEL